MHPTPNSNRSVTLGFLLNDKLKNEMKFWNDPNIIARDVNATCERCPLTDCKERVAPPYTINKINKEAAIEEDINMILSE
jgi:hypothetical protein